MLKGGATEVTHSYSDNQPGLQWTSSVFKEQGSQGCPRVAGTDAKDT